MEKLRTYRKEAGITQSEFAKLIGIQQASVSRIESGLIRPDWRTAKKIADATKGAVPLEVWASEKGAA